MNKVQKEEFKKKFINATDSGNVEKAMELAQDNISIIESDADLLYLYGVFLGNLGHHENALNYFEKSLRIDVDNPSCLLNYVTACFAMGAGARALKILDHSFEEISNLNIRRMIIRNVLEATRVGELDIHSLPINIKEGISEFATFIGELKQVLLGMPNLNKRYMDNYNLLFSDFDGEKNLHSYELAIDSIASHMEGLYHNIKRVYPDLEEKTAEASSVCTESVINLLKSLSTYINRCAEIDPQQDIIELYDVFTSIGWFELMDGIILSKNVIDIYYDLKS